MFKFIVRTSLRNRLFVLAVAAALVAYGLFVLPRISDRRASRHQPADRQHPDRGGRAGPSGSRATRHVPDRDVDERHAGRHPRALGVRRRALGRLRRIRLGRGRLSRAAVRLGASGADPRATAVLRQSADGAGDLHHGRNHADRAHQRRQGVADGGARDRGFRRQAAASRHSRRGPGDPDRRRGPPIPGHAQRRHHAGARRHARPDRAGGDPVRHQQRRRLRRPARPRISDPQCRPDQADRRPRQHRRCRRAKTSPSC